MNSILNKFLKFKQKIPKAEVSLLILSFLGLLISLYLFYLYQQPNEIICLSNCQKVRESDYSSFLGIQLPIWGVLYYLGIFIYTFLRIILNKICLITKYEKHILVLYTTIGFSFSLYLTYIEAFILGLFCDWCLASAAVSTLIFLVNLTSTLKRTLIKNNVKFRN